MATWMSVRYSSYGFSTGVSRAGPAVIAGIETVRTSITELADEDFTMVIVDEAHRVKDPRSQTTKALHQFPTRLRYGLTGEFQSSS